MTLLTGPDRDALIATAQRLQLNHRLSQNFLVNPQAIAEIAQACVPNHSSTQRLVEIGCGAGFLTHYLHQLGLQITGIEIDDRFIPLLKQQYPSHQLIHNNVLKVDFPAVLEPKSVVVGNLPYHLTGPILFHVLGELTDTSFNRHDIIDKAVVMVQKEVAERLCAKPSDSAYSQMTIMLNYWYTAEYLLTVKAQDFEPAPKVDSAVVVFTPKATPSPHCPNLPQLQAVLNLAFMHRRKTLANNLKLAGYASTDVTEALNHSHISATARAQDVTLEAFIALSARLPQLTA